MAEKLRAAAIQGHPVSALQRRRLNEAVFDLYRLEPHHCVLVEDMLATTIDFQKK